MDEQNKSTADDGVPDGGPAFPQSVSTAPGEFAMSSDVVGGEGMSLRDWFAGQVLGGMCAKDEGDRSFRRRAKLYGVTVEQMCARISYAFADAMLEERKK